MEYKYTVYEKKDGIARTTLNRPERLNAILRAMLVEVEEQLEDFRNDETAKVWVVTGAGRGFCSGDDLDELKWLTGDKSTYRAPRKSARMPRLLQTIYKPTIAMVNGPAAGMGFELAIACDFMIASDKAKFGEVYVQRGAIPSSGPWLLPRKIGLKNAIEIVLLADVFDAQQAEKYGLTYKVVPHEQLETATMELTRKLMGLPSVPYYFAKRALLGGLEWNLETELEFISVAREAASKAQEAKKGIEAFWEKKRQAKGDAPKQ